MVATRGFADQSIAKTYLRLRVLVSIALVALPLLAALSAHLVGGYELQPSLSDYYFVARDGGLPRTIFLVFLAFLGCVLVAYRGLDDKDNLIHNAAGFCSFGVALFPMHCDVVEHPFCVPGLLPILHLPSAGLLYICAVISVIYGGGPKLKQALGKLPESKTWFSRLRSIRILSAVLMTIGIVSFFVHVLAPKLMDGFSWIFWVEYTGFFGFGIYWLRLMLLINDANKAGQQLKAQPAPAAIITSPMALRAEHGTAFPMTLGAEHEAAESGFWEDIP